MLRGLRAFSVLLACAAGFIQPAGAQSYVLTNGWVGPATTTSVRDMAYSAVSNEVFIANTGGSIAVYDGTAGTSVGSVSFSGVTTSGTQTLNQMGVADDGVIYGANLVTAVSSSSVYRLYRWPAWNAQGVVSYAGDPTAGGSPLTDGGRIGDSFAITGAGTNTWIVAGVASQHGFILFSSVDGTNFTPTELTVPSGFTTVSGEFGLAFYTNNTIIAKPSSGTTVYLIQFPTNWQGQASVTGTVLSTSTLATPTSASASALFSFSADKRLLGVAFLGSSGSSQKYYGSLYSYNPTTGATLLASTNTTAASNGNLTGGVALGGAGKTNFLYVLNSANTMEAYSILAIPPQPPSITTEPVGGSVYPPYTISVSAVGTGLGYQWQASTNDSATESTFTNIAGATSSSLTVTGSTNYYQVIITNIAGAATSAPVQVVALKAVTNTAVSKLWTIAPGVDSFLPASGDNTRGIAYDTNSQRVVIASTSALNVLNANNGTNIETLSLTGVSFSGGLLSGTGISQVAIADDGAVYACDVVNSGANLAINRWSAPSNSVTPSNAYSQDPGNGSGNADRWGDTLAVRGAGANTQILLASRANSSGGGTNVALLIPNDGMGLTYSSMEIAVSNVPSGFAANGICFGAGNTFWAKDYNANLYEISFNTNLLTGAVVLNYASGSQVPSATTGVSVDAAHNILGMIKLNDTPNDLQLSQLTGTSDSPVVFDQSFFASANANGNENGVVTLKYPRAYALDVNNGVVAVTYGVPATTAPVITTPPASVTAYTNVGAITLSVSASGSLPLYYQWQFNSTNIPGATASTYTLNAASFNSAGTYDVVVHNIAGSVTSTPPAVVSLIVPTTSPTVTPLWSISPGTNSSANDTYLTSSGYETRGLAYDPASTNLLIADDFYIHDYSALTGEYQFDLNTAGLPNGGINGWTIDQIGVADDGTLYSANLSPDGTSFAIASYGTYPYGALYQSFSGNTLNTLDPIGDRWGDTMAIRGSGVDTEILFGSYSGTNVALFTTSDGFNFTPQIIAVSGVPAGFSTASIAFGPGNTFYCKGGHYYDLREIAFDTNSGVGTVLEDYVAPNQIPNNFAGVGVDITNNIMGGVCFDDSPNDVQLYLLSGNTNSPGLSDQDFFPAFNANAQLNAVTTLKGGVGFALDVNNGVVGFTYSLAPAPAVSLTSVSYVPGRVVINWNNTFDDHSYEVFTTTNLASTNWTLLGTVAATNATASFTDTTTVTKTRFYRVVSQ